VETRYREYQRQAAWPDKRDRRFEAPERQYRVRKAMTLMLMFLTNLNTTTKQEARIA
jgi:hypothetical protein